jgi:hypothetical protein
LLRLACGVFYRDDNRDTRRTVVVAGTARSGTSWLGELLTTDGPARLMFEPFHPRRVQAYRRFNYFQYRRPADDDPALLFYCRRVLSGEIRHRWIDRELDSLRPERRVVKDIRACLFLKWLRLRFPEVPLAFVIRHPCAVVLSRLRLGWATDGDIEPFHSQPDLLADFLADKVDLIRRASTPEAKHAVVWCVSNLVPLRQLHAGDAHGVFYERLCLQPGVEIPALFRALGLPCGPAVLSAVSRPSRTVTNASAIVAGEDQVTHWQRHLAPAQVRDILAVVEAFGLSHLYDDSPLPRVERLWSG